MEFTRPNVAALKLPAGQAETFHWDKALPGFGVRLRASGAKRFVVQYRGSDGGTRRAVLGDPGLVLLDKARDAARKLLAEVRLGADPQAEKARARNATTFSKLAESYLAAACNTLRAGAALIPRNLFPGRPS